jgi:hypothetical protein
MSLPIEIDLPAEPGTYEVTLSRAATPDTVLARREVRVVPPSSQSQG